MTAASLDSTSLDNTSLDTLDLGRLAVIGESFITPENDVTITVVDPGAAPALHDAARYWEFALGGTTVVLADVASGLDLPAGLVDHFAASLGVAPTEVGQGAPGAASGSVLLVAGPNGPLLVGLVTASAPSLDEDLPFQMERRMDNDAAMGDGLLSLGVLREVPLEVSAELGHTRLSVAEILQLTIGSVIELDRTAGAPIDVVANGSLIARGEVVVIDDEYGIRITEIVGRVGDAI